MKIIDSNDTFPICLAPKGTLFSTESVGKMTLQVQNSVKFNKIWKSISVCVCVVGEYIGTLKMLYNISIILCLCIVFQTKKDILLIFF